MALSKSLMSVILLTNLLTITVNRFSFGNLLLLRYWKLLLQLCYYREVHPSADLRIVLPIGILDHYYHQLLWSTLSFICRIEIKLYNNLQAFVKPRIKTRGTSTVQLDRHCLDSGQLFSEPHFRYCYMERLSRTKAYVNSS